MTRYLTLAFDGGGLCNRIFPFANAVAAGLEHQCKVINPVFGRYARYFCGSCGDADGLLSFNGKWQSPALKLPFWRTRLRLARRFRPSCVIQTGESQPMNLDRLLVDSPPGQLLWLDGLYILANASFVKHADAIRQYFRPVLSIEAEVAANIACAREGADVLVGTHIRQGDYQFHDHGMLYYDTAEYAALMRKVTQLFPGRRVRFLVCSNVTQNPELLSGLEWTVGPGSEIGDLYALAACDYIIGAPSTYTQWASFYGRVPRLEYNRKYIEKSGQKMPEPSLDLFVPHQAGFGRFAVNG